VLCAALMLAMILRCLWLVFMISNTVTGTALEPSGQDATARLVRRFQPLADLLPARGSVGFFGEGLESQTPAVAQYTLAPLVLDIGGDRPLSIACFETDEALRQFLRDRGYRVRARVSEGLAVVEKDPR